MSSYLPRDPAFPDRQCEVAGCDTGLQVLVFLERQLCVEHIEQYEAFENLLNRRRLLLTNWLEKKSEAK